MKHSQWKGIYYVRWQGLPQLFLEHFLIWVQIWLTKGFPCGSVGKESACNAGDLGTTPGEGKGYPLQYSGEFHGLYSPWGLKESDTTERLSLTHSSHQNLLPLMLFLLSKTGKNKPIPSSMIFQNFEVFFFWRGFLL